MKGGGAELFGRDHVQNTKFILCDLLPGGSQRTGGIQTKHLFPPNSTVAFIYSIGTTGCPPLNKEQMY